MVADKGHQPGGCGIHMIASQHLSYAFNRFSSGKRTSDRKEQRIVKHCVDAVIDTIKLCASTLEERNQSGVTVHHFPDDSHRRIFTLDCRHPIAPKRSRYIRPGILTDSIDTSYPNPPKGVLNFVTRNLFIRLVHIRKNIDEPSVKCGLFVFISCVR